MHTLFFFSFFLSFFTVFSIFVQNLYYYNFAETMFECYVVWKVTWQNVHYKQSVLQGHTAVVVFPPVHPS